MNGVMTTKGEATTLFIELERDDFFELPEFHRGERTILQRKDEFHITLFREKNPSAEVAQKISKVLELYESRQVRDIVRTGETYLLTSGEKHSLIAMIESKELKTILSEIHRKFLSIGVGEVDFPPLHITLYTDLLHSRGIGVLSYDDLRKFTSL